MNPRHKAVVVVAGVAVAGVVAAGVAYAALPDGQGICASKANGTLSLQIDADSVMPGFQCPGTDTFVDLHGAPGQDGAPGKDGADGTDGVDGKDGSMLAGYVRVAGPTLTAAADGTYSSDAVCPAGSAVLGGGFSASRGVRVHRSAPRDGLWRVGARLAAGQTLRAWAVCATAPKPPTPTPTATATPTPTATVTPSPSTSPPPSPTPTSSPPATP
jgi:hypothetical protein